MSVTVRMISPQLHVVAWSGGGEPTAADPTESDELLQLATSRRAGAQVLIVASDGSPRPRALDVLTEGTPAFAATIVIADEERALRFHAPRGRGRVFELLPLDAGRLDDVVAELQAREGLRRLERAFDEALAAEAARLRPRWSGPDAGNEGKRTTTHAESGHLEPVTLQPADRANARVYAHQAEGAIAIARRGPGAGVRVGLLIRGRESFELRPRADGQPFTGHALVVTRLTAPEDRGVVLRVELDDEDLGPWRLGATGSEGEWSRDDFTIASDLIAGRASFRLAFTPAGDAPIATFGWTFGAQREIAGTWLFDLEPSVIVGGGAPAAATIPGVGLFSPALGLHQRGFELKAGTRVDYALPAGYARFTAVIHRQEEGSSPAAEATIAVELDGATAATIPAWPRYLAPIDQPIRGARRLSLAFTSASTAARLMLLEPALLR